MACAVVPRRACCVRPRRTRSSDACAASGRGARDRESSRARPGQVKPRSQRERERERPRMVPERADFEAAPEGVEEAPHPADHAGDARAASSEALRIRQGVFIAAGASSRRRRRAVPGVFIAPPSARRRAPSRSRPASSLERTASDEDSASPRMRRGTQAGDGELCGEHRWEAPRAPSRRRKRTDKRRPHGAWKREASSQRALRQRIQAPSAPQAGGAEDPSATASDFIATSKSTGMRTPRAPKCRLSTTQLGGLHHAAADRLGGLLGEHHGEDPANREPPQQLQPHAAPEVGHEVRHHDEAHGGLPAEPRLLGVPADPRLEAVQ